MSPPPASCPDTEALCEFIEGHADAPERDAFERHLDGCAACRRALVALGRVLGVRHGGAASEHHAEEPRPSHEARSLGRYEIRGVVGAGGMGVVYVGWDPALGRRVALKLTRPDQAGAAERLAAEARALAKVTHPNVLTVFDVGVEGGAVFLAAEYVEGATLDKAWPEGAAGFRKRVEAYVQAGRGLAAIHAAGLTHRDIKPANLLLGEDGRVRVADFGLAVSADQRACLAGTRAYMAPEQRDGEVGPAVDQFALGLCLVEALTGERPEAGTAAAELARLGRERWGSAGPEPALWEALARAIAIDPAARHRDVEALVAALVASLEARPVADPGRARVVSFALVGVALATLAAAGSWRDRPIPTSTAPGNDVDTTEHTAASAPSVAAPEASSTLTAAPASSPQPPVRSPRVPPASARFAAMIAPAAGSGAPRASGSDREEAFKLLQKATLGFYRGLNGKECLELIERAEKLDPALASYTTQTRALCEMRAGKCEQGAQRMRAAGNDDETVKRLRLQYCPADDTSRASAEERVLAVSMQATLAPYTVAHCEQLAAQLEQAIGERGSTAPTPSTVAGARSGLMTCFARAGDCARARVVASALVGPGNDVVPGQDRETRAAWWVASLHPKCASAR
ncbi:protein kinase domain-containing protein [Polyangium jinanense]|uniref:Protein kinase n=1 Tax=Polyangium jinanense TaxID=2829994 RepID=A0A9X4AQM7_9BACT|nr:protein kinase [Polyangium jinanense]MDC3952908.1 protein kinase [Polyangium jinanense]MDC3980526.1 protein kinase [Polyangium jinanense]